MKIPNQKLLAVLAAALTSLAPAVHAAVVLPTPAEQLAFNPRISMVVGANAPISWTDVELSNVPPGYSVTNGNYVGWCVDSFVPIDVGVTYEPILYSSYDDLSSIGAADPDWDLVNYIINRRAFYVANLGATASEFQDAIYNLVGGGGYGQLGLENGDFIVFGFPAPNMAIVAAILADATANGEGFVPAANQLTAVILDLGPNVQRQIIEVPTPPTAPTGRIGDFVWRDLDHDGIQDAGEPGIPGVTVTLKDGIGTLLDTMVTDANGLYLFTDLVAGTYQVCVEPSAALNGLSPTFVNAPGSTTANDSNPNCSTVILPTDSSEDLTIDFGYFQIIPPTGKIGDFVWYDTDHDGIQDAGEPGIGGVTVTLKDSTNTVIDVKVTNASGIYCFTGLKGGTYYVCVQPSAPLAGLTPTIVNAPGSTTANDSNPNCSTVILPTDSSVDLTIDFGYWKAPSFQTQTMGGWGQEPSGSNTGMNLKTNFLKVYPGGYVQIGGTKYAKFTSQKAIEIFLPSTGTPAALKKTCTNPPATESVFAGQVLALRLNVDFSAKGYIKPGLGSQKLASGPWAGKTVVQFLAIANTYLGGAALPSGITYSLLSSTADKINNNYVDGVANDGFLIP